LSSGHSSRSRAQIKIVPADPLIKNVFNPALNFLDAEKLAKAFEPVFAASKEL
jgi:hypothetical protein